MNAQDRCADDLLITDNWYVCFVKNITTSPILELLLNL